MADERCTLTELLVDQCSHCRGHNTPRPPATIGGKWRVFTAAYPGKCAHCGEHFNAGDDIARLPNQAGYLGPCCTDQEDLT